MPRPGAGNRRRPPATRGGATIETARLRLRRARMADLDDLHAIFSDPRAMRYWSTPPNSERSQTAGFLRAMVAAGPPDSDDFIIEADGRAIGKAGCWTRAEIGVILHPDYWRRGLAQEALGDAIPHCFTALSATMLSADVDPRNIACLRLLARLGFRETGRAARTFLVGGEWCDSVYLALDASRWPEVACHSA
jgi:[ribosomal protein S5]-alanine N-acetyltransferase